MNFHSTELEVIRWAEANDLLIKQPPHLQTDQLTADLSKLRESCIKGIPLEISEAMGRTVIDLIILCAMLDIDLTKCLDQAFEKISAKPAPSNVVFLKKD